MFHNNIWSQAKLFWTPLIFASKNADIQVMKLLLGKKGIDVSLKDVHLFPLMLVTTIFYFTQIFGVYPI